MRVPRNITLHGGLPKRPSVRGARFLSEIVLGKAVLVATVFQMFVSKRIQFEVCLVTPYPRLENWRSSDGYPARHAGLQGFYPACGAPFSGFSGRRGCYITLHSENHIIRF